MEIIVSYLQRQVHGAREHIWEGSRSFPKLFVPPWTCPEQAQRTTATLCTVSRDPVSDWAHRIDQQLTPLYQVQPTEEGAHQIA